LFFTLNVLRYKAFFSYEWEDLALNNQLYWNISQGNIIEFTGFTFQHGKLWHSFHVTIIGLLGSVIYSFVPYIYTLFFMIAFSLAIAAVPIYKISRQILGNNRAALLLSLAYLLYAPKHSLNFVEDPTLFSIPLLLFTFYAALSGKKNWFITCSILVMFCRTVTPAYITVYILYFYAKRKEFHKIPGKTYLFVGKISIALLIVNIILHSTFGVPELCESCRPIATILPFDFLSDIRYQTLLKFFWPVFFVPVFTIEILLGLPSLFFFIMVEHFSLYRPYYMSNLIPAIFIGVIYFIKRMQITFKMKSSVVMAAVIFLGCLLSNFTNNIIGDPYPASEGVIKDTRFLNIKNIYDKRFYVMDEEDKMAWRMINKIPNDPDIAVSASGDLLAPLSSRKKLLEFLTDHYDYYDVDYILIHNRHMYMGAGHYDWDDKQMKNELQQLLVNEDWDLNAHEGTFYLFKRK